MLAVKYRRVVYCELEFLKKFRNSFPRSLGVREELVEQWWNVSRFINQAELELNVSKAAFLKEVKRSDYLMKIFKRGIEHNIKFKEDHGPQSFIDRWDIKSGLKIVYMLNVPKAEGQNYARKKGTVVLTPTSWQQQEHLFRDNGNAVVKNDPQLTSWREILFNKYNLSDCNSMLIVDKYLLSKDINNFNRTNICDILDALLPQRLQLPKGEKFHITIITDNKAKVKNCDKKYEVIKNGIARMRPDLECELEILCPQECPFHDRVIITNNVLIGCGAGFDLFNVRGAIHNTTITIVYPGIQNGMDWCEKAYESLIQQAGSVARKIKDGYGGECYSSDARFCNRLFDNN